MEVRWKEIVAGALGVLGTVVCGAWGMTEDERVEALLSAMSLEDRVGQVMVGFFRGATLTDEVRETLRHARLGGVILYASTGNIENPGQVAALVREIQHAALREGLPPLFVAIDQEGGIVSRLVDG